MVCVAPTSAFSVTVPATIRIMSSGLHGAFGLFGLFRSRDPTMVRPWPSLRAWPLVIGRLTGATPGTLSTAPRHPDAARDRAVDIPDPLDPRAGWVYH